ncbi:MAG: hypothetical protein FWC27_09820 [Firmicutes bacterium]|nr:hypothetical protein [Bacillota bacterium]
MTPEFDVEKRGYNKQQVDEYIDYLLSSSEPQAVPPTAGKDSRKRPLWLTIVSNAFYAVFIASVILGALAFANSGDPNKSLFGVRFYAVESGSMEPELPKGSVIVVKQLAARDVAMGDYLTFYRPQTKDFQTHAVIEVIPDYLGSGQPGFRTQGIKKGAPVDLDVVFGEQAVGKVVYCLPKAGYIFGWIGENVLFLGGMFLLICGFFYVLGKAYGKKRFREGPREML